MPFQIPFVSSGQMQLFLQYKSGLPEDNCFRFVIPEFQKYNPLPSTMNCSLYQTVYDQDTLSQ